SDFGFRISDFRTSLLTPAATVTGDAFDGSKFVLDAGQEPPSRTVPRAQRHVGAQARAALRRAVAFQDPRPELAQPQRGGGFLDFFGPGDQVAQAVEIVRMGLARVAGQKSVRAEKN